MQESNSHTGVKYVKIFEINIFRYSLKQQLLTKGKKDKLLSKKDLV